MPSAIRPETQPMRADNSSHLIEAAQQRRLQCIARVRTALDDMERGGGPVTIAGVAARALLTELCLEFQQFSG
jgi:hypothetical protein